MFGGGGGFGSFNDLFEQHQRRRGPDLQAQLRITLREAASGVRKTVHVPIRNVSGKRESRKVEVDIPAGEHTLSRPSLTCLEMYAVCVYTVPWV